MLKVIIIIQRIYIEKRVQIYWIYIFCIWFLDYYEMLSGDDTSKRWRWTLMVCISFAVCIILLFWINGYQICAVIMLSINDATFSLWIFNHISLKEFFLNHPNNVSHRMILTCKCVDLFRSNIKCCNRLCNLVHSFGYDEFKIM